MYKFKYELKNKLDGKVHNICYKLNQIEKGINKLFDINNFEILSKKIYLGLNDSFNNEIYHNDKVKIEEYYNKDFSNKSFDEKNLILNRTYTSFIQYEDGAFLISDREDGILNIHINCLFDNIKKSQPFFKYEIVENVENKKTKVNEFKFKYEIKNKLDGKVHNICYELNQIEKGINKLFDINNFEILSRNIYTGLNDNFNNEIYHNDKVKIEINSNENLEVFQGKIFYEDGVFLVKKNDTNVILIEVFFNSFYDNKNYKIFKI